MVFVIDEQKRDKHCIGKWYIFENAVKCWTECAIYFSFVSHKFHSFNDDSLKIIGFFAFNLSISTSWLAIGLKCSALVQHTLTKQTKKKLYETDSQKKYVKNIIVQQKYDSVIYGVIPIFILKM